MRPLHYEAICKMLLERFGEPIIGDNQGVPTSPKKKDMGNRGFGVKFKGRRSQRGTVETDVGTDDSACYQGKMNPSLDEEELDEKTPPGREKQVRALKKNKNIDNPWAIAWASWNKTHKK